MLLTKLQTPSHVTLPSDLKEMEIYLRDNIEFSPTSTMPMGMDAKEKLEHKEWVNKYRETLIKFNKGLEAHIDSLESDADSQVTTMMNNHKVADNFRKEVEKCINAEVLRFASTASEEMKQSEFYQSWVQNSKNKLFKTYGF